VGIKRERDQVYNFQNIYNSLKFYYGKDVVRIVGTLENWNEIEIICRIFYKKLEELLYSKEICSLIYEKSVKKVFYKNNMLNKTFFEVLKEKNFHLDAMKILLMKIDDFVYHNVRKYLPYSKELSLITNSVNELLENVAKYSSGDFCMTCGLKDGKYPLVIKLENAYDRHDKSVKQNLENLADDMKEVNKYEDPSFAMLSMLKRSVKYDTEEKKESRLGLAKIRVDTGANLRLILDSDYFGKNGLSVILGIPLQLYSKKQIISQFKSLLKKG
jgi:hypothetical protein